MVRFDRVIEKLARIFGYVGGIAVAGMAINVLLDASLRTLFNSPIPGTLEYVQYWWMILLGFMGWALASYTGEHIDAPIIGDRLSVRAKLVWQVIAQVSTLLYLALVGWFSWLSALHAFAIKEYVGGNNTLIWPMRFVIPISALLFALVVITKMIKSLTDLYYWGKGGDRDISQSGESVSISSAV